MAGISRIKKLYVQELGDWYQILTTAGTPEQIKTYGHPEQVWEMGLSIWSLHGKWLKEVHFTDIQDAMVCLKSLGAKQIK